MGITGNISTMSLADVFQWLQNGQKTGTLGIAEVDGPIRKEIHFQEGLIISASSNDPEELIGQFMVNTRQITEKQLGKALEAQKRDQNLLGRILVEQKIVSGEELQSVLRTISEEIIFDLFLWKEGNFEFRDGDLPNREMPALGLDITHLCLEGSRRGDDWKRIKDIFPDNNIVVRPNVEVIIDHLPLDRDVGNLLQFMDGFRTIDQIIHLYGASPYRLMVTMLDLHEAEFILVGDYSEQVIPFETPRNQTIALDLIKNIREHINRGRLNQAEKVIKSFHDLKLEHADIKEVEALLEQKLREQTLVDMIKPESVPVLNMTVEEITKMDLSPEQGFMVSRINGVWDVKSIIRISPFGESSCMKILTQFIKDGVIKIK